MRGMMIWDAHCHLSGVPGGTPDERLAQLITFADRLGIERVCICMGMNWSYDPSPEEMRRQNDEVLAALGRWHHRAFGFVYLTPNHVEASLAELDRCVKRLGMKGILLYTNLAGKFPDEPEFRWLFHRAVELDVPILLHPPLPVTASLVKAYEMISTLGNMFDDTIALTRLIMSGLLDQLPRLKVVCPHLGGTLPYIIGRMDHQVRVLKRGPKYLTRLPSEYLKLVWLDIVSPLPLAMRYAYDMLGAGRLVYSSDRPWVNPKDILDGLRSLKLPAEEEAMILGGNAHSLFCL